MDKFIMWSFPLIVITIFLLQTVSKPDMPHIHIELRQIDHPPALGDDQPIPRYEITFQ
jgi:hypothetical protein